MKRLTLLVLLLAGCATEPAPPEPSAPVADAFAPVLAKSRIYRPQGAGPFPAVVVLHGCGGVDSHHHGWARRLVQWGYVAMVVDSFRSRGHGSVCALNPQPTTPAMRAWDAQSAARHLATLDYVRAGHIGVIGFSHGGITVMEAVQAADAAAARSLPFAAAVAFYPLCSRNRHRDVAVPTLVLIGEQDDWTPAANCRELVPALRRPDLVSMTVYPNAYHGFDREPGPTRYVQGGRGMHRMERDADAVADALPKAKAFFDSRLKS